MNVPRKSFPWVLALGLALLCFPPVLEAKRVTFPMTIDFSLLRSLVVYSVFRDVDETAVILNEGEGCRNITLARPVYTEENGRIRFETRVSVTMGTTVGANCVLPVKWEGIVVLFQRPVVLPGTWTLCFETEDSAVLTKDREPATVAGLVWDLIKTRVYDFLKGIRVDLGPPVGEVRNVLLPLFREDSLERAGKMLESLHPGAFITGREGIRLEVLAEVEEGPEERKEEEIGVLEEETLRKFIDSWEVWDTYLVSILLSLSRQPLTEEDRQILLTALLEARYRFIEALSSGDQGDFIREEFVTSWKDLSPVFRHHLGDEPSRNLLRFLAFFTASDALETLDQVGSTLGIEISRNGWIRLIRLLTDEKDPLPAYNYAVSRNLRRVVGMGRAPDFQGPSFDDEELDDGGDDGEIPEDGEADREAGWRNWLALMTPLLFSPAWAGEAAGTPDPDASIRKWVVRKSNLGEYMNEVRDLLAGRADEALTKSRIPERYNDFYHDLVLSTAWQESCFRQFREKNKKIGYLRSYNGTSVGIMQVNERVWRGLYDGKRLRWDIEYNTLAGCQILDMYLWKYVLNRRDRIEKEIPLTDDLIARMVYAVYNGGPSQVKKFTHRAKTGQYYDADKLFNEKYEWVKNKDWEKIRKCLIGG